MSLPCLPTDVWAHIYYIGVRVDREAGAAFARVCHDFHRIRWNYWECWHCHRPAYERSVAYACDSIHPQLCGVCEGAVPVWRSADVEKPGVEPFHRFLKKRRRDAAYEQNAVDEGARASVQCDL